MHGQKMWDDRQVNRVSAKFDWQRKIVNFMCKHEAVNHFLDKDHADVLTALSSTLSPIKTTNKETFRKGPLNFTCHEIHKHDENA